MDADCVQLGLPGKLEECCDSRISYSELVLGMLAQVLNKYVPNHTSSK